MRLAEVYSQMPDNVFCQLPVGVTGKHHHLAFLPAFGCTVHLFAFLGLNLEVLILP
jgi:hypothetical protein